MSANKNLTLAAAIAALAVSPLALADGDYTSGPNGMDFTLSAKANLRANVDTNTSERESETEVEIEKEIETKKDVEYKGSVDIDGSISGDSLGLALINDEQQNNSNNSVNVGVTNRSSINGNSLRDSEGNVAANVASGDNNMQANSAALAAADGSFVFGHADAEAFGYQDAEMNNTINYGVRNSARVGGNALRGATGNVGVNVASGASNAQSNQLTAAVASGAMGEAAVSTKQVADHNNTVNEPLTIQQEKTVEVSLLMDEVTGQYAGVSDQDGDQYLDTWSGQTHPGGSNTGHIDVDDQVQNANDDPQPDSLAGDAEQSDGGAFSFHEAGEIALAGTASGSVTFYQSVIDRRTTNSAFLGGNSLRDASGNIGVNVASGSNNLQSNSLSLSSVQRSAGAPPTGEGGQGL